MFVEHVRSLFARNCRPSSSPRNFCVCLQPRHPRCSLQRMGQTLGWTSSCRHQSKDNRSNSTNNSMLRQFCTNRLWSNSTCFLLCARSLSVQFPLCLSNRLQTSNQRIHSKFIAVDCLFVNCNGDC